VSDALTCLELRTGADDIIVEHVGSVSTIVVEMLQANKIALSDTEATLMALGVIKQGSVDTRIRVQTHSQPLYCPPSCSAIAHVA